MARPSTNVLQQTEQSGVVAARKLVAGYPVPVRAVYRHKPALLAQFDCNENCANMADGGRACVECLHLTSPMVRVLETQIYRMRAHCPIESTKVLAAVAPAMTALGAHGRDVLHRDTLGLHIPMLSPPIG